MDEDKGLAVDGSPLWDGYENDKDRELRRSYGMKLSHYNQLLELQGGVCAICQKPPPEGEYLRVDEDHDTWEITGLLCEHDNKVLTERRRRYVKDPPARVLGWTVPADRVEVRRKRNADRAQARHAARLAEAEKAKEKPNPYLSALGLQIRDMTRPDPDAYAAQTEAALAATAKGGPQYGWSKPPPPPPADPPPQESRPGWRRFWR